MNNLLNKAVVGIFSASIAFVSVMSHAENTETYTHNSELHGSIEVYSQQNVIQPIYFESGKAVIQNGEFSKLEQQINQNAHKGSMSVVFVGHTDNQNLSDASKSVHANNMELSKSRAETVMTNFQEYLGGRSSVSFSHLGMGPSRPAASNQTQEGMSLNRRVEVHFIYNTKEELRNSLASVDRHTNNDQELKTYDTYNGDANKKFVKTGELAKLENVSPNACAGNCDELEAIEGPVVSESIAAVDTIEQAIRQPIITAAKQDTNPVALSSLSAINANQDDVNVAQAPISKNSSSVKWENEDKKANEGSNSEKVAAKEAQTRTLAAEKASAEKFAAEKAAAKEVAAKEAQARTLAAEKVAANKEAQASKSAACGGYAYGGCYDLSLKSDFKFREVLKIDNAAAVKTASLSKQSTNNNISSKTLRNQLVQTVVKQDAEKTLAERKSAASSAYKAMSRSSATKEVSEKSALIAMNSFTALKKVEIKKEVKKEIPVVEVKKEIPVVQVKKEIPVVEVKKEIPVVQVKKEIPVVQVKKEIPVVQVKR